jgi:hypothetical protein
MKRMFVIATVVAGLSVPVAPAVALGPPEINCGIVSCTYQIERKVEEVRGATSGVEECVQNGIGAVRNWLQGTPQPGVCNP